MDAKLACQTSNVSGAYTNIQALSEGHSEMITYITLGSYFHIYDTIDLLTNRLFDGIAPSGADATDD